MQQQDWSNTLNRIEHNHKLSLTPTDNHRLLSLCGECNAHLHQIEKALNVKINQRGNQFEIKGDKLDAIKQTETLLTRLYAATEHDHILTPNDVHLALKEMQSDHHDKTNYCTVKTSTCSVSPRGKNQQHYLNCILENTITFGIGPAGTGKTFLAIACASQALERDLVDRVVLVRPAVEAGESLGFLPGDLHQKVDPYLRPLYDSLYTMFDQEKVFKYIQTNRIEVAPLAYMRGRTLNDSFIVLDEAQNATRDQMKMFLTRIGFGSTAVITGDITQVDLPSNVQSGLIDAMHILKDVNGIHFCHFNSKDIVRHPLVQSIVDAYEQHYNSTRKIDKHHDKRS